MLSILNVIIQNAVPKCSGCINESILFLCQLVGYVLIAFSSKKINCHTESYLTLCDLPIERELKTQIYHLYYHEHLLWYFDNKWSTYGL
jgi:hypothetical protein